MLKKMPENAVVARVSDESARFIVPRASASREFVAPFWYLRVVDKCEEANFELVEKNVKCPACFPGGCEKKAKPPAKIVTIPVVINTKRVAKFDEMTLYREPPAKAAKVEKPLRMQAKAW